MKNYILGAIIGVCLTTTVLSVWTVIQTQKRLSALETAMVQVVSFINSSIQQ